MKLRILTALVLAPLAFLIIGWSPDWLFLFILLVTVERALYEYFAVTQRAGFKTVPIVGYVAAGAMCLAQAYELRRPGILWPVILSIFVLAFLLALVFSRRAPAGPKHFLSGTLATVFGILYVGFAL